MKGVRAFFTYKKCIYQYGVNVQQEGKGGPPLSRRCGGVGIGASALEESRKRSIDEERPFDMEITVANVIAHETLFHHIAGFNDPITKHLDDRVPNPQNIEAWRLTRYLWYKEARLLRKPSPKSRTGSASNEEGALREI